MTDTTGWWTISQTARHLGISDVTVGNMIRRGDLTGVSTPWGKNVRWWIDPASVPTREEHRQRMAETRRRAARHARAARSYGEGYTPEKIAEIREEYAFFRFIGMTHEAAVERVADAYRTRPGRLMWHCQLGANDEAVIAA